MPMRRAVTTLVPLALSGVAVLAVLWGLPVLKSKNPAGREPPGSFGQPMTPDMRPSPEAPRPLLPDMAPPPRAPPSQRDQPTLEPSRDLWPQDKSAHAPATQEGETEARPAGGH